MKLEEFYPKEWNEIKNHKIPEKDIDKYLLSFVAKLLNEVKQLKREEIDLGDGNSMLIHAQQSKYKIDPLVYGFLFRLGDYGLEDTMGRGDSEYGEMLYTHEEVETELKKVAKKLRIKL